MITQNQIRNFLSLKTLAIIGVSRSGKKFGNAVFKELLKRNYNAYPVHPEMNTLENHSCYNDLKSLPSAPDGLIITTNKDKTFGIVKEAHDAGIKNIWIQQMSDSKEALDYCKANGINVIYKQCLLMYLEPVEGFHAFHRFLKKIFGGLPK